MKRKPTWVGWLKNPAEVERENKRRYDDFVLTFGPVEGPRRYFAWAAAGRGVLV